MDYYEDVYLKRLNRFGLNYQSRVQGQREKVFEGKLLKSLYRVDFLYEDEMVPGTLERYKQNETRTFAYLLTRVSMNIPAGTVLMIQDKDGEECPWMIYYLENIKASGYNKYIVVKMTHFITWTARNGEKQSSWAYMYGQEDNMLKDEMQSRSRMDTYYTENLKLSFFLMPVNENLRKDDYLEIGEGDLKEAYRVTGYDIQSTPGVSFVSADPVYIRDLTPPPELTENEDKNDFYWLMGGFDNGNT